jgi:glycosyltransferase involved in cell wall biosynthesis
MSQHPIQRVDISPLASGFEAAGSPQKTIRVLAFVESHRPTAGPARNLIEFGRRAASEGHSDFRAAIAIATFQRDKEAAPLEFIRACEKAGLETHVMQERFRFDVSVIRAMKALVSSYKPAIVQSHAVKSHFLIRLSKINREYPWIAFHHGYTRTDPKARAYNYLDRWSLPPATKIVTVCRSFAGSLETAGIRPERLVIQHNSVSRFFPSSDKEVLLLRELFRIQADTQIVLCVGRLSQEKGQADLIEAAAVLRSGNKREIQFLIVGDGPDERRLKGLARSLRVEDWFIFTGYVVDLRPYYTIADLVVLPSHTEGSPNVLLEAMAAGLPIVATAVGGVPEIVSNEKEALLVEGKNPAALAQAIERLLSDTFLRRQLSETAQKAISAYSPAEYCESMLSLYKECLAKTSRATVV